MISKYGHVGVPGSPLFCIWARGTPSSKYGLVGLGLDFNFDNYVGDARPKMFVNIQTQWQWIRSVAIDNANQLTIWERRNSKFQRTNHSTKLEVSFFISLWSYISLYA